MNGIHEVTGSIPVWSTNLRSMIRRRLSTVPLQCIVYVLKNADKPPRFYTGLTADLAARLEAHNAGRCSHTAKHRPWAVDVIVKVGDET